MYRHNENQLKFVEFELPFGGHLLASNRWVRMAHMIPWGEFEEAYCANLSKSGTGPPAFSVRMALAALIIKERLGVSDEECVEQIQENPYLQYFCGLRKFQTKPPFHPTMFVRFRKRFPADVLSRIKEVIVARAAQEKDKDKKDDPPAGGGSKASDNNGHYRSSSGSVLPVRNSYRNHKRLAYLPVGWNEHESRGLPHRSSETRCRGWPGSSRHT